MPPAPATTIGPYRVVRTIGLGGWSTVYEVVGPGGETLALKRSRDDLPPAALARFQREVESLRRISHPGVLRLVDSGLDGNAPYLVTPVVDGNSLRALGTLGVDGALAVVAAAAEAVAAIHAAGLVHRDLKPENLMITAAGDVVVIDLGLALGPEHSRHTEEHAVTGSVPYMAPEQIEDRVPSAASDVWALCVVLYEAAAGRRPFERVRGSEEVAAILAGKHEPLAAIEPRCAAELSAIVERGLESSPARRPADAGELARALAALAGDSRADRARLVADPAAYAAAVASDRARQCADAARVALLAGDRFAASRHLERGLAYAPDDRTLRTLLETTLGTVSSRSKDPARIGGDGVTSVNRDAGGTFADGLAGAMTAGQVRALDRADPAASRDRAGDPASRDRDARARDRRGAGDRSADAFAATTVHPSHAGPHARGDAAPETPKRRHRAWIAVAVAGAIAGAGVAVGMSMSRSATAPDPEPPATAARPPTREPAPPTREPAPPRDPAPPPADDDAADEPASPAGDGPVSKPSHVAPTRGDRPVSGHDRSTEAPPRADTPGSKPATNDASKPGPTRRSDASRPATIRTDAAKPVGSETSRPATILGSKPAPDATSADTPVSKPSSVAPSQPAP